jgi:uncharacterized protein
MPEFTSHAPGTFCWPELSTTDQKGAVTFYRSLFGWNINDQPMGPNETYSMFEMRGKSIGAAYSMRKEERDQHVPPHWGSYVAVANADESAKQAEQLGGKTLAPAFDVMDAGRMAVLQDPTGAVFQVWQSKKHAGAGILNEPGALCWTELMTRDTPAAEKFYTKLFGWSSKTSDMGPMKYTEFSNQGKTGAGMMEITKEMGPSVPPNWMPYFQVTNVDATFAKAKELGGAEIVAPRDIPNVGRFAVIKDPQGAVFSIFTPAPR